MGCPTAQVSSLPKSFSVSSSKSSGDQDLSELIKVASARSLSNKIELDLLRRQPSSKSPVTGTNVVPRSMSVGIGRIDEDKPCEFGEISREANEGQEGPERRRISLKFNCLVCFIPPRFSHSGV
ncbi:hypothetical protein CK203_000746 [Vitis vinifera]|uniref:Uncharacterized protein n=1 Tax=Vitis vinifera TaxID=29760 RepID=A0A438KRU7_VITVI|nr:hypothetical protein CK203_000746 [Vitis vinifera]